MTKIVQLSGKHVLGLQIDDNSMLKRLNAISSYFGLGTVSQANRIGGVNKNYAVRTSKGDFVFKLLAHRSLEPFEKELVYLKRIGEYHFPVPHYLSAPDGSIAFQRSDFVATVMPKLPGEIREPSEDVNRQIGLRLAQLHSIPTGTLPQKSHWLSKDYLPHAIEHAQSAFGQDEAARSIEMYKLLLHFDPDSFPQSIIHGDLHLANCLFTGNELSAILDWEDVGIGACVLDFAWSVLSFCFIEQLGGKRTFDTKLYKHLFDGYTQIRCFTNEEKSHMGDAVRYVCLTFYIWIWFQLRLYYPEKALKDEHACFDLFELDSLKLY